LQQVRRAAGVGRIHVAELQSEVIRRRDRTEPWGVAGGAEIAVDIVLGKTSVVERAFRDLGVELHQALVRGHARRVLVDADDVGLVSDAHRRPFLPFPAARMGYRSPSPVNPGLRKETMPRNYAGPAISAISALL